MEEKKGFSPMIIIVAFLVIIIAVMAFMLFSRKDAEPEQVAELPTMEFQQDTPRIGYAIEGVTIVDDEDARRLAEEEARRNAEESRIAIWYQNDLYSTDGKTFTCFLGNSRNNQFDMYFDMYYDSELKDEIFLSELIVPGSAFETIELNRELDVGTHRVYLVMTTVETTEAQQIIKGQFTVTVDLHVTD